MKATFQRQYRSRKEHNKGKVIFVYNVSGTPEELAAYKKSKGEFYTEEKEGPNKGAPLMFTDRFIKKVSELRANTKGEWVADTTADDQLKAMVAECGGNVELALHLLKTNPEA